MKEIKIDELKQIQLEMLMDIHTFCKSHGIKYSLAFGSLLGAVRHHGFIPWDDDVDIMLQRDEYERFIHSYGNEMYRIVDMSNNLHYCQPFAKVENTRTIMDEYAKGIGDYGVFIDVFPVDNVPNNISERKIYYRKKSFWNVLHNLKMIKISNKRKLYKNIVLAISHFIFYPIPIKYITRKMSVMSTQYKCIKTKYVGIFAPADSRMNEVISASCFDEYIEMDFEGIKVMVIKGYDEYLTAAYGNYMKLPPIEKQVSHHVFKAWWK